MNYLEDKHLIMMGFKHVGKSTIGRSLADKLGLKFIDIDEQIEFIFKNEYKQMLTVRNIIKDFGDAFFRDLEHKVLVNAIKMKPSIISLGGGTPLEERNTKLLKEQIAIHVVAPRGIVFERIMVNGRPGFFSPNLDPFDNFNRLWDERKKIYENIANFTIENNDTIDLAVETAINKLTKRIN